MGKRGRGGKDRNRKGRDGGGKRGGGDWNQNRGTRGDYSDVVMENELYETYYKESGLVPEEEWPQFWESLKKTLPTTFRFTGSKAHAVNTMKTLKEVHVPHLEGVVWDGELVDAPKPLPWYPDGLAWSTAVGKSTIRRCPPFKKFQSFLVNETTVGNISRQESVSMIPPLLMDVEPHHTVLDMCAAPGSKTAQIIEALHKGEEDAIEAAVEAAVAAPAPDNLGAEGDNGGRATGLVIANDSDYRRSHMLIHQTKRLNSPNLMVTNHDATMFPSILTTKGGSEYLKFDRILADVPCSGDGTTRKNYSVWRDWNPHGAMNLHMVQQRILLRGLQMLKVGGRIVYSTCSMNPVENEAVVAAAIDRCGGPEKVQIVDSSDRLPELKRRPGVTSWRVMDKDKTWYSSWEEVAADTPGREARMSRITKSMFPIEDGKDDSNATRIQLERCLRIYPHLQDTGGFFIVVLEKKQEIRAIKEEPQGRKKAAAAAAAAARAEKRSLKSIDHSGEAPTEEAAGVPVEAVDSSITNMGEDDAPPTTVDVDENAMPVDMPEAPASPTKRKLESPSPAPAVKKIKQEESEASTPAPSPAAAGSVGKKKGGGPPPEEPFKYLAHDHPVLQQIYAFYELSARFPRNCFMVRNAEGIPARAIYFTSQLARAILEANDGKGVRFVHCGVKAFMKQDVQSPDTCPWRIQNEGLAIVAPWIGESRVVRARKRTTVHGLLRELFPKVAEDVSERSVHIEEIEDRCRELGMGCCILKVAKGDGDDEFRDAMVLPLWKSRASCNLMLPKDERRAMLMRLFNDDSEPIDSTKKNSHTHRDAAAAEAREALQPTHVPAAPDEVNNDLVPSKDGVSMIEPPDTIQLEGMRDPKPVTDVDPINLQPAPTAAEGTIVGAASTGAKIPTEDEIKKEVDMMEAQRVESDIKDEIMEGNEL